MNYVSSVFGFAAPALPDTTSVGKEDNLQPLLLNEQTLEEDENSIPKRHEDAHVLQSRSEQAASVLRLVSSFALTLPSIQNQQHYIKNRYYTIFAQREISGCTMRLLFKKYDKMRKQYMTFLVVMNAIQKHAPELPQCFEPNPWRQQKKKMTAIRAKRQEVYTGRLNSLELLRISQEDLLTWPDEAVETIYAQHEAIKRNRDWTLRQGDALQEIMAETDATMDRTLQNIEEIIEGLTQIAKKLHVTGFDGEGPWPSATFVPLGPGIEKR